MLSALFASALTKSEKLRYLQLEHYFLLESLENKPPIVEEPLDQNHVPSQVLELDLHIRPVGTASGHMALLGDGKLLKPN